MCALKGAGACVCVLLELVSALSKVLHTHKPVVHRAAC